MSHKTKTSPVPVRFLPRVRKAITHASKRTGLSEQDTIRLTVDIGLLKLADIGFDIPRSVLTSAETEVVK